MKFRNQSAVGVLVALTLGLAACSSSGSDGGAASNAGSAKGNIRVWFMQDSVPASAQKYLKAQFAKENPGSTLTIEVQQWDGILQKLQTSLPSSDQTPDLVETGNTQTSTFSSVNAFTDISALKNQLGGDHLIASATASASWKGKLYGVPLYAGARAVYYRTDLFKKAGVSVPTTISAFMADIAKLQAANPDKTANFSAIYLAASDLHAPESWLFANGGGYAKEVNGKWVGQLSDPASLTALKQLQTVWKNDTKYGQDSIQAANGMYNLFNAGKVGMMVGTGNIAGQISPALMKSGKVGMFAFPSDTAGQAGKTFAGGSNIGISAASKHQSLDKSALKIIMGKQFQSLLASDGGWVPGNLQYADALKGPFAAAERAAVANSELTPNTPQWGVLANNKMPQALYTELAKGNDPMSVAKKYDAQIEKALNAKS